MTFSIHGNGPTSDAQVGGMNIQSGEERVEITVVNFATGDPLSGFSLDYDVDGYYEIGGLPLNKVLVVVVEKGTLKMKNLAFSQKSGPKEKSVDLTPTSTVTVELVSKNRGVVTNSDDIGGAIDTMQKTVNDYYSEHTEKLEELTDALVAGADLTDVIPNDIYETVILRVPKLWIEDIDCWENDIFGRLEISTAPLQPRKEITVLVDDLENNGETVPTFSFYEYVFPKNTAVTFTIKSIQEGYEFKKLSFMFAETDTTVDGKIYYVGDDEQNYYTYPEVITLTSNITWGKSLLIDKIPLPVQTIDFIDFTSLDDDKYLLPLTFNGEYIKGIRFAKDADNLYVRMDVDDALLVDGKYNENTIIHNVNIPSIRINGMQYGVDLQYSRNNGGDNWMISSVGGGNGAISIDGCDKGSDYVGWCVPIDASYFPLLENIVYNLTSRAGYGNGPWEAWIKIGEQRSMDYKVLIN